MTTHDLLDHLLTAPPPAAIGSLSDWAAGYAGVSPEGPAVAAVLGGFLADRPGYASASGYQAACRRLVPEAPADWLLALCATEEGGGHPRAIQTRLAHGRLTGEKRFVTLGTAARGLIVIATTGTGADGRSRLKAALVDAAAPGVTVLRQPALPFVPEIPHAALHLSGAMPVVVLAGDGYTDHLKPFRTIEDVHVHLALISHLVGVGRGGWSAQTIESLLVLLCALLPLSAADPRSAGVHRALGGILARLDAVREGLDWSVIEEPVRQRWQRDQPLLQIARRARQARLLNARSA